VTDKHYLKFEVSMDCRGKLRTQTLILSALCTLPRTTWSIL